MRPQATTVILLLIVCAVLGPLAVAVEPLSARIAIIAVQLICLFLIGLNVGRPKTDNNDPDVPA